MTSVIYADVYREEKSGFFARLTRRGAKKNSATDGQEDTTRREAAGQVDPAEFPDVKSRKSTLPPLYPNKDLAADADEAADFGGRKKKRRRAESTNEVDGQHSR